MNARVHDYVYSNASDSTSGINITISQYCGRLWARPSLNALRLTLCVYIDRDSTKIKYKLHYKKGMGMSIMRVPGNLTNGRAACDEDVWVKGKRP